MWIAQAYASTIWEPTNIGLARVGTFVERAIGQCTPDITAAYMHGILAINNLRDGHDDQFRSRMQEHASDFTALVAHVAAGGLEHPATLYVNRVKHARAITLADLTWESLEIGAFAITGPGMVMTAINAVKQPKRPANAKEGQLLRDLVRLPMRMAAVLPLFVEMHDTPARSPQVKKLTIAMRKTRPSEMPYLVPIWNRLVKERVGFGTRIMMALGLD